MNQRRGLTGLVSLSLFLLLALSCYAQQQMSVETLLAGKAVPFTLKVTDMTGNWQQFSLGNAGDDITKFIMAVASERMSPDMLFPILYSKGETVTSGGENYLLVYQRKSSDTAKQQFRQVRPHPESEGEAGDPELDVLLTADTELVLSLINVKSITRLDNIRPFDGPKELAATEKRRAEILKQREETAKKVAIGQMGYLAKSVRRWASNHKGVLPPMKDMQSLLAELHENPTVYGNEGKPTIVIAEYYAVNTILSGKRLAQITTPASMVLFYQITPSSDATRVVVFLNGTVKRIAEAEWPRLCKASKIPLPAGIVTESIAVPAPPPAPAPTARP